MKHAFYPFFSYLLSFVPGTTLNQKNIFLGVLMGSEVKPQNGIPAARATEGSMCVVGSLTAGTSWHFCSAFVASDKWDSVRVTLAVRLGGGSLLTDVCMVVSSACPCCIDLLL